MKIGAAVTLYNREQYIGPYLEQLEQHGIIPVVALSDTPWGYGHSNGGNEESSIADKSDLVLRVFFPHVKVVRGTFLSHRASFDAAVGGLSEYDCDRIIVNDCDIFMASDSFRAFIEEISTDADVFKVNHETMITEYYLDERYGLPALSGGPYPLIAYNPRSGMRPIDMTNMSSTDQSRTRVWDTTQWKLHHFRFTKLNGSGKSMCVEPATTDAYTDAPPEIKSLLEKWRSILTTV